MKYSEAKYGRIFIVRLEDGDIIHKEIEALARMKTINAAGLIIIGGADSESRLIVGPENGRAGQIHPMEYILDNVHEVSGTGTIFPDSSGDPELHMHMSCGRETSSITGCIRNGVKVWHVMEVIIFEFTDTAAFRSFDPVTGFKLLQP
ncbi:MAG: DNA-binding protein [Desulfobacteraceae bacterium]|jgi:predicted DNA-binding protein with PD1-like motif|nr:DNA-binding protein [Desulfobacteraceae bacterium]